MRLFMLRHGRGYTYNTRKGLSMQLTAIKNKPIPPVVREYDIGDTKYIVSATSKAGATEDAAAKVRRLLRKEIHNSIEQKNEK